jgi:hypothetical protein
MARNAIFLIIASLALGLIVAPAGATQVIQQTPQQLAQASSLIVDGKVASVRSYWNEDHSKILTEATVDVAGTHKGRNVSTVRVVQLGGVVGNVRMTAHGAVTWKRGEDVLLFLEPSLPGAYQVTGFSQGKYRIERDPNTGAAFVQAAMPDGVDGSRAPASTTPARAAGGRMTLEQFLNRVLSQQ